MSVCVNVNISIFTLITLVSFDTSCDGSMSFQRDYLLLAENGKHVDNLSV